MPYLSFDKGDKNSKPIARVKGGSKDGEILYLHLEASLSSSSASSSASSSGLRDLNKNRTFNRSKYVKSLSHLKQAERTKTFIRLEEAYHKNIPLDEMKESEEIKAVYDKMCKDASSDKTITLDDEGMFELLPSCDPTKREVWYIAGQSGSGKSFVAKQLAGYYHKLYPERGVYLISKLKEDATLDTLKFLKRIDIQSFVDDYPDLEEFKDCLTIWDDYDTLVGPMEKAVTKIIDDLAIMGRHTNSSMLCLSHYLTNYKKTRLLLNEATNIVVYPMSTSYHALRHLLRNYVGVDEEDLKRQRKLGSRWLSYSKGFPQYMISQKSSELLHQQQ